MKKNFLTTLLLTALAGGAFAQQDAMFTHYMYNTQAVNPAYCGSRQALTITALHRSQWIGFDGAPLTQTLTLHTPVYNDKIGLGLSVMNDRIGPVNMTSAYVDFAYRLKLSERNDHLAFGLKGGVNMMQGKFATLETDQQGDPTFTNNVQSQVLPNFGFGMYYQATRFYAGISTPKLLENKFDNGSGSLVDNGKEQRHYFLIAGAMLKLNNDFELKPTMFVKATKAAPIEADVTASIFYHQKFWAGAMYRTGDAAGVLIGINAMENLSVGYSFDWSFLNSTLRYNNGSHEIMLRYDLVYRNKYKVKSPRYF